ncbi:MAG: twin-arginine translocase subunit TatC [Acidobacteriaceae bacterium]|nr:twin-arginine translocase subunit TatC [Acidobacteriaceae bacterium]
MLDDTKEYGTPNGAGPSSPDSESESPVPVQLTTAAEPVSAESSPPATNAVESASTPTALTTQGPRRPPPPPPPSDEGDDEDDEEEKGMLRMSFMEHLEELRTRIIRALMGLIVAFMVSIGFCKQLWNVVSAPAVTALKHLGINPPNLAQITPMEQFNVIYLKLPLLCSIFVGSPWVLYQVWAFISPGLYKREKKWAVPFIACTAGLFIAGGCFAYFVAFRYGLEFLLGIGRDVHVTPVVSINEYFDLFVNVTLGVGLVFEMPVIIFFLTLLRLASPRFLLRHSRYAILAITIIAAIVTPTPDVFNMMLFAVPMVLLFYVGILASYILVMKREGRRLPWTTVILIVAGVLLLMAGAIALLVYRYHFHFVPHWPFLAQPLRAATKH